MCIRDRVKATYWSKRCDVPICSVLLVHDNATFHTAAITQEIFAAQATVEHPPYSPDLSPSNCQCWTFEA